jgi:hypothetical protein
MNDKLIEYEFVDWLITEEEELDRLTTSIE